MDDFITSCVSGRGYRNSPSVCLCARVWALSQLNHLTYGHMWRHLTTWTSCDIAAWQQPAGRGRYNNTLMFFLLFYNRFGFHLPRILGHVHVCHCQFLCIFLSWAQWLLILILWCFKKLGKCSKIIFISRGWQSFFESLSSPYIYKWWKVWTVPNKVAWTT